MKSHMLPTYPTVDIQHFSEGVDGTIAYKGQRVYIVSDTRVAVTNTACLSCDGEVEEGREVEYDILNSTPDHAFSYDQNGKRFVFPIDAIKAWVRVRDTPEFLGMLD